MIITIKDADFSSVKIGVDDGFTTLTRLSEQKGLYLNGQSSIVGGGGANWGIEMFDIRNYNTVKVKHSATMNSSGGVFAILCDAEGVPADDDHWMTTSSGAYTFPPLYIKEPRSLKVVDGWTSGTVQDVSEQTLQIDVSQGYKYMWVMKFLSNTNPVEVIAR